MSIYSIPTLIGFILTFALGCFVLFKKSYALINRVFSCLCFTISGWIGCYTIAYSTKEEHLAFIYCKIACTFVMLVAPFLYHFIVILLGLEKERKFVKYVYYSMGLMLPLFLFTNIFLSGVYKYYWGFYSKAGVFHPLFLLWFFAVSIRGLFLLFAAYLKNKELSVVRANQLKYVFFSSLTVPIASFDFIPKYGFEFYPFGWIFSVLFSIITAYAVVRHQLMDIEVIIKKSLVFAGMFIFAFGIFVVIALLISQFVSGGNTLLALALSALIITLLLRPIEAFLINVTDKFLFQRKYQYKEVLKKFIDAVITELNLDEVINSTLKLLDQTLHPHTASIFILNKVDDRYQIYSSFGLEDKEIVFASESKLASILKRSQGPVAIKQINGASSASPDIAFEMSSLKAVLALPLMLHDDLIGFIALGKKKSDEEYTKDDLDVLLDLARTESIAVGNAQLLQEAAQSERRAAIGTMSAGINHEIGNPLNIINTKIQLFLEGVKRGLYEGKTKEEILRQCQDILTETINQTNRIADITRRLSNFAKPSKEFKPELLSIPDEINETLAVVGHDLELERIKIEKQFSPDLFKILADKREIQQIFFNLIRNAGQAIEGSGKITISAANTINNKIHIEIKDTGKGITEDKVHRIFEPFFTTKGPNKGTGLGLSIVRQLVWKNKGEISFKSQANVGTIFILEFPKGE